MCDIDFTFKILERDRCKHTKILNENKLRPDRLKDYI
jgi:hypothetical protein